MGFDQWNSTFGIPVEISWNIIRNVWEDADGEALGILMVLNKAAIDSFRLVIYSSNIFQYISPFLNDTTKMPCISRFRDARIYFSFRAYIFTFRQKV